MQQMANARSQRETLVHQYQQAVAQSQPQQHYVSDESRRARRPEEMDAQDMANVLNESRFARLGTGRGFTADDYNRLRTGLTPYKNARGEEHK
jgi:hypothetical protein